ncbi:MAG: hypothetical protein ACYCOU_27065, partial [Sulfobacillus sp.]
AEDLANQLLEDDQLVAQLGPTSSDRQPFPDKASLKQRIKQSYLRRFVHLYIATQPLTMKSCSDIDEQGFLELYDELMASVQETHVRSMCVYPLWHFGSEEDEIILDSMVKIRLLTPLESSSLSSLVRDVGTFPLLDLPTVKYGIEVAVDVLLQDVNNSLSETLFRATLDAMRLLHRGDVQAPLRFHTLLPPNRWRKIIPVTSWTLDPISPAGPEYLLAQADVGELTRILSMVNSVRSNLHIQRIRTRLHHLYTTSDAAADRLVDSLIILESIFLDESDTTEITYKLSSRAAVFLEEGLEKRKQLKSLIKKLYKLRSKVVHGSDILPRDLRLNGEPLSVHQFADHAEEIVRKAIVKRLQWDKLIEQHGTQYFDDLLLT